MHGACRDCHPHRSVHRECECAPAVLLRALATAHARRARRRSRQKRTRRKPRRRLLRHHGAGAGYSPRAVHCVVRHGPRHRGNRTRQFPSSGAIPAATLQRAQVSTRALFGHIARLRGREAPTRRRAGGHCGQRASSGGEVHRRGEPRYVGASHKHGQRRCPARVGRVAAKRPRPSHAAAVAARAA